MTNPALTARMTPFPAPAPAPDPAPVQRLERSGSGRRQPSANTSTMNLDQSSHGLCCAHGGAACAKRPQAAAMPPPPPAGDEMKSGGPTSSYERFNAAGAEPVHRKKQIFLPANQRVESLVSGERLPSNPASPSCMARLEERGAAR